MANLPIGFNVLCGKPAINRYQQLTQLNTFNFRQ